MISHGKSLRGFARLAAFGAFAAAHLFAATISFDEYLQAGVDVAAVPSPYESQGFRLTDSSGTFFVWESDGFGYAGLPALTPGAFDSVVTLERVGGGLFSLYGLAFAPAAPFFTNPVEITLLGYHEGGTTTSQTVSLDGNFAFTAASFGLAFAEVTKVEWGQPVGSLAQFTNIEVESLPDSPSVPEPSTAFVGLFLVGVAVLYHSRTKVGGRIGKG